MRDARDKLPQSGHFFGMNQVGLRLAQLMVGSSEFVGQLRSLQYLLFQRCILGLQLKMKMASLQQILHPKLYLGPVERLGEKVMGAVRQCLLLRLRCVVAREHENWQIVIVRDHRGELIHSGKAVDVRHMEVEHDQVRPDLLEHLQDVARVAQAGNIGVTREFEHGG